MNIEMARSELVPVLAVVAGVVERRQTLPILGNLLVRATDSGLAIRATDLELEIGTQAAAEVEEAGQITLPARKFFDICRSLPEGARVRVRSDGERAIVSSGRSRFTLSTLPAADFPTMGFEGDGIALELRSSALREILEKTAFAMAQQDVRYYLNGVLLEVGADRVVAVATDGHRLAKAEQGMPAVADGEWEERQLILPAKTVSELKRLLPASDDAVRLEISERTIRVELDDTVLVSKLIDGRYPEYGRVIPAELPLRATVDKDGLRAALQRAAILSSEKYKGVRVTFDAGVLRLQSQNPEKEEADEEVEIDYEGEKVTVGFNVGYILDVLQAAEGNTVEVLFRDGDSSAVLRGLDASEETFVIMPMRL